MLFPEQRRRVRKAERGYVLLTLLLMMAVMAIVAATVVTDIKFEIQRDREEEMIHRGVQYSRAIRVYYKKFGRYPATIENLENTNQLRFLRKRYKDPITGKDFKLLHFGEVRMGLAGMPGMGGGVIPGANTVGPNGTLTPTDTSNSSFGNNNAFGNPSAFGQNAQTPPKNATDSSQTGTDSQSVSSGGTTDNGDQTSSNGDQTSSDQPVRTFGGMPIVGVASTSKGPTIREFDKKKKYNEWLFIYDPSMERGLLITTPYQPQLQMFGMAPQNFNQQNPTPGLGTSAPGTGGTSPSPAPTLNNNTLGNPNQPTDTPNQQ
jgi:type II secretory pathway pseudopilin PulG